MDSLVMSISGFTGKNIKGASVLSGLTGGADKEAVVPVKSVEWAVNRNVTLDVGNGNNSDTGELTGGTLVVTKSVDGLTPAINTILFKPKKGRDITITYGTPKTDGIGLVIQRQITLSNAKVIDYQVSTDGNDEKGKVPLEKITIAFSSIKASCARSGIDGKIGAEAINDIVEYNFSEGVLKAGTKIGK